MVVLGGWAVSYERGTPVGGLGLEVSYQQHAAERVKRKAFATTSGRASEVDAFN